MARIVDRTAWLIAPVLSAPLAAVVYARLWPCFIAARADVRFALLLAAVTAMVYMLLTARSQRALLRRAAEATVVAVVCATVSGVLLVDVTGAMDRGRQKWTMANMRKVALVIATVPRNVPLSAAAQLPEWQHAVAADTSMKGDDGWGNPIQVAIVGDDRYVVSFGACGKCDVGSVLSYQAEPTHDYEADLVMKNGEFIRYPQGEVR